MKLTGYWLFANAYKCTYLILIVINLTLTYVRYGFNHEPYIIALVLLVANSVSWLGFLSKTYWGRISEVALSIGRMLAIAGCATLLLMAPIIWTSPVGSSLWQPLLEFSANGVKPWSAWNRIIWWTGCGGLLALETTYFYCVTQLSPGRRNSDAYRTASP